MKSPRIEDQSDISLVGLPLVNTDHSTRREYERQVVTLKDHHVSLGKVVLWRRFAQRYFEKNR